MGIHLGILFDGDAAHRGNRAGGAGFTESLVLLGVYFFIHAVVKEALFFFGVAAHPCLAVRVGRRESLKEGAGTSAKEGGSADEGCFWKLGGGGRFAKEETVP